MPAPPPGFYNRRTPASAPHQHIQAHLPARPSSSTNPSASTSQAAFQSATISAEPELRDLKKEATAFVPAALRKKKAAPGGSKINAAPSVGIDGDDEGNDEPALVRPDLLGALKEHFPTPKKPEPPKKKDEYAKFLEDVSDLL
jgi:hypothetical protein